MLRKIKVTAKNSEGCTTMHAKLGENDFAAPITLRIVMDQSWRRVGKAKGECDADLRDEVQSLSLRDAVLARCGRPDAQRCLQPVERLRSLQHR